METTLFELRLEDKEENGEGVGWEVDQDVEEFEEDLDLCIVVATSRLLLSTSNL